MKFYSIDFSSFDHTQAQLEQAYDIIREVFQSLPSLALLKSFRDDDGRAFYDWLNEQDTLARVELVVGEDYSMLDAWTMSFTLITAISRRRVDVILDKETHGIVDCVVRFPSGSIHAAARIWHELFTYELLPSAFVGRLSIDMPVNQNVRAWHGSAARFLWPLHLVEGDEGYLGQDFDTEYCISSLSIDGARRDEHPDEYGRRLLTKIFVD